MMLLLAAALAVTPVQPAPVTDQEIKSVATACMAIATNRTTAGEVVNELHLDSPEKIHGFLLNCYMLNLGVNLGFDLGSKKANTHQA